jgi:FAD/FMN-containing dehydrogenase
MQSRKEIVDRAITFRGPERVPIVFWNRDQASGEVMLYHLSLGVPGDGNALANVWDWSTNEWSYRLQSLGDGTMGHPTEAYWSVLPSVEDISVPPLREDERMAAVPDFVTECGDCYRLASLDLSGFTVYTLLRGFENAMLDFVTSPDRFQPVMDLIMDFECRLMEMAARHGFHGIHFADDRGTQDGLMLAPELWRRLFKPGYRRQFARAHDLGLHVWYHCCGDFAPIIPDFHEIGVDVLNISQPNTVDLANVGRGFRGKLCFLMPVSYQTVSITGTHAEILAEAQRMYSLLAGSDGGFIGYVEEYGCMGMSEENYRACGDAFRRLRTRDRRGSSASGNDVKAIR